MCNPFLAGAKLPNFNGNPNPEMHDDRNSLEFFKFILLLCSKCIYLQSYFSEI